VRQTDATERAIKSEREHSTVHALHGNSIVSINGSLNAEISVEKTRDRQRQTEMAQLVLVFCASAE